MINRLLLLITLCIAFNAMTIAQDSLWFAGQYVKIGTPKAKIFDKLAAEYQLSKVGETDQWGITTKSQPYRLVGLIAFDNGKVSFVNKSWGSYEENQKEPFDDLYRALSSISDDGKTMALLQVTESKDPQGSIKEIRLHFGKRYFSITISDLKGSSSSVGFSEILQK